MSRTNLHPAQQPARRMGTAGTLFGIQALRAVAALLVVAVHAIEQAQRLAGTPTWNGGSAGVDIFFVISGVMMILSARTRDGTTKPWRDFALHRFVRIAPPYWAITTLKILMVLAAPALTLRTQVTIGSVAVSYLFLPWVDGEGVVKPILAVAWTLYVEAAFYAACTVALALRLRLLASVAPVLMLLAVLSPWAAHYGPIAAFYADPIMLDLVAGLCLGVMLLRGWRLPAWLAIPAVVGGLGIIVFVPPTLPRFVAWELPAMALVAGTLSLEPWCKVAIPRLVLRLGDASYAIYLTHALVLPVWKAGLAHADGALPAPIDAAIGFLLAAAVGLVAHERLERPLLHHLWQRLRAKGIAAPRSPVPGVDSADESIPKRPLNG